MPTKLFALLILYLHGLNSTRIRIDSQGICGHEKGPICCPGWRNGINAPCTIPVCAGNCGDRGQCIRPNICQCADRHERFACDVPDQMQNDASEVQCPDYCNRRGNCVRGKCKCLHGYQGSSCELAIESACFSNLDRGLCVNPISKRTIQWGNVTTMLTQEVCCNAFGVAWGEPCQMCRPTYCGRGYHQVNGACRDINECTIPGVCRGGHCVNHEGAFRCECSRGYRFDSKLLACVPDQDACQRNGHRCSPGGRCIALNNDDYQCKCNWRYTASADGKSCHSREEQQFNLCNLYKSSVCKNGQCIPRGISYECNCNKGFQLSRNRKYCRRKIDMCIIHQGYLCKNGACVSTDRDFYCNCNPGFTPSYDRRKCLNACEQQGQSVCQFGYCVGKHDGDYICQCQFGYKNSADGKQCIPANNMQNHPPELEIGNHPGKNTFIPSMWYPRHTDIFKDPLRHNEQVLYPGEENIPPCERQYVKEKCAGGFCLNLGGEAYQCECFTGYKSSSGGRRCEKLSEQNVNTVWQNDAQNSVKPTVPTPKYFKEKYTDVRATYPRHKNSAFYQHPCNRHEILDKCRGGFCLNLGGRMSYRCECLRGYESINGGKQCQKKKAQFENTNRDQQENTLRQNDAQISVTSKIRRSKYFKNSHTDFYETHRRYKHREFNRHPCNRQEILNKCRGGFCLNLGGRMSYRCECLRGYESINRGKQCQKKKDPSETNSLESGLDCKRCTHGCYSQNKSTECACGDDKLSKPLNQSGFCAKSDFFNSVQVIAQSSKNSTVPTTVLKLGLKGINQHQLKFDQSSIPNWKQFLSSHLYPVVKDIRSINFNECIIIRKQNYEILCPILMT